MGHGVEKLGENFKALALEAFGLYSVEQAIQKTVEFADHLADTSIRLGIAVEDLQEFQFAAKQTGASVEQLTTFIEKLNASRFDPKKRASFAKFGIGEGELHTANVTELVAAVSSAMKGRNPQEFGFALRDVGGRGAGALVGMLQDIDDG